MKKFISIVFLCLFLICFWACVSAETASAQSAQNQITTITPGTPVFVVNNGWYQVTVRAGTLTVYTTGDSDTELYIYDSSAKFLAGGDGDAGEGYNERISITVSAGTYYIRVTDGPCALIVEAPR